MADSETITCGGDKTFDWLKLRSTIIITFVVGAMLLTPADASGMSACCQRAVGSCRTVCEKMSLAEMAADTNVREDRLQNIYKFCSPELVDFWTCMNITLQEIVLGSGWWGRQCCMAARGSACGAACATFNPPSSPLISSLVAPSMSSIAHGHSSGQTLPQCRPSDEVPLYQCIERMDKAMECCSQTQSPSCASVCREAVSGPNAFSSTSAVLAARKKLTAACREEPQLRACARQLTRVQPAHYPKKYLRCCDQTPKKECRETCKHVLKTKTITQDIMEGLEEGGCGPPLPHDPLWQCFLRADSQTARDDVGSLDKLGVDSAKLHCCQKAVTPVCKKLCSDTYSIDWLDHWEALESDCLLNSAETALASCVMDVEEPCEIGCGGLWYCSGFNTKISNHIGDESPGLYRGCTPRADLAASQTAIAWQQQGYLELPGGRLPMRNTSFCNKKTWKSVACTLQIKPCTRKERVSLICREDCLNIVTQCVDWSRMEGDETASEICSKMSPEDQDSSCIPLKIYDEEADVDDKQHTDLASLISSPCTGDVCGPGQVCEVNRNCLPGNGCIAYRCTSGCPMGEASGLWVPTGTYIRVPILNSQRGCLKICVCGDAGVVEKCQPLPCFIYDQCVLPGKTVAHGEQVYLECNICTCYAGELICSKRVCSESTRDVYSTTSLPCACPSHHVPVCASNGNTYPNACLAKCAELLEKEIEFGSCAVKDLCKGVVCHDRNSTCVARSTVCLSLLHQPCPQHICVTTNNCANQQYDPVCDKDGKTYRNLCEFLSSARRELAYHGPCLVGCLKTGKVCGINGNTYDSECAAWASFITVDYFGPCMAVGQISDGIDNKCKLDFVTCPPLPQKNCMAFVPPGACCPKCGGGLRILYSRKQIDRALYALRGTSQNSLTLNSVLKSLQRHILISECALRGFLTIEGDIFVSVESIARKKTDSQLEACILEAEKLAYLINTQSARISSELSLSALSYAVEMHEYADGSATSVIISSPLFILAFILSIPNCMLYR